MYNCSDDDSCKILTRSGTYRWSRPRWPVTLEARNIGPGGRPPQPRCVLHLPVPVEISRRASLNGEVSNMPMSEANMAGLETGYVRARRVLQSTCLGYGSRDPEAIGKYRRQANWE